MKTMFGVLVALTAFQVMDGCSVGAAAPQKAKPLVNKRLMPPPGAGFQFFPQGQFPALPAFPNFQLQIMPGFQPQPGKMFFKGNLNGNGQKQQEFDNLDDFLNALNNQGFDPMIVDFFQKFFQKN